MKTRPEQAQLNATKTPTAIDVAWAAGIWEGEGHCRNQRNRAIDVTVVQKDPEILYRLRDLFGGSVRLNSCKTVAVAKQCYQWEVCGDRARFFLAQIYELLSQRRRDQVNATGCLHFLGGTAPGGLPLVELKQRLLDFYEAQWSQAVHKDRTQRLVRSFRERHGLTLVGSEKEKVS